MPKQHSDAVPGVPHREGQGGGGAGGFPIDEPPRKSGQGGSNTLSPAVTSPVQRSPGVQSPRRSPDPEGHHGPANPPKAKDGPADADSIRATLINFFLCYSPQKLTSIPKLVSKHRNDNITQRSLVGTYRRHFNMQPVEREAQLCLERDLRTRLYCFYAYYDWDMMDEVERLASKYRGMDRQLFQALERKYGAEPMPTQLFSGASPAERKKRDEDRPIEMSKDRSLAFKGASPDGKSLGTGNGGKQAPGDDEFNLSESIRHSESLSHYDTMRILSESRVNLTQSWQRPPPAPASAQSKNAKMDPDDFSLL